jgi:diketogulonate reductase-like aldo/keto reductase
VAARIDKGGLDNFRTLIELFSSDAIRADMYASELDRDRREMIGRFGAVVALAAGALPGTASNVVVAQERKPITRPIPATGERLPAIGVGTWITFSVTSQAPLVPVLQSFFDRGGAIIDSSPMYGRSEAVIGRLLEQTTKRERLFSATKIWTFGKALGRRQFEQSKKLWGVDSFDLLQIHNMLQWETHLETLKELKAARALRYIGITTSHGRRHDELERALTRERFDFVQVTYSLADRSVEERLLPVAAERGIAVVANRPFDGGNLFSVVKGKPLPAWAHEFDCENWAQFFLKFIVSHPAVTCAIPATSSRAHMSENMGALYGRLPDTQLRARMVKHLELL